MWTWLHVNILSGSLGDTTIAHSKQSTSVPWHLGVRMRRSIRCLLLLLLLLLLFGSLGHGNWKRSSRLCAHTVRINCSNGSTNSYGQVMTTLNLWVLACIGSTWALQLRSSVLSMQLLLAMSLGHLRSQLPSMHLLWIGPLQASSSTISKWLSERSSRNLDYNQSVVGT